MTNTRATVQIKTKADRNLIARWAAGVPDGTTVEFRAPRRSSDANALMWSLLTQISKQLEWAGEKRSAEDWKDLTTAALRGANFVPGMVRPHGRHGYPAARQASHPRKGRRPLRQVRA
jgi:hypothetical protein